MLADVKRDSAKGKLNPIRRVSRAIGRFKGHAVFRPELQKELFQQILGRSSPNCPLFTACVDQRRT